MEQIEAYIVMFGIIVIIGHVFRSSSIPIALIFVITGFLLCYFPFIPKISINPDTILNFFLPLLVYQASAFSSWRDIKKNIRPIALLSVGHVIFITILVAICIHAIIPNLGWPMSFVLGAVVSPPDDVAILSIAENIRIPERIFTILEGEAVFNDAAALTIFRFALIAFITHQFSPSYFAATFFMVIFGETAYGLILGNVIGIIRQKISNPAIHIIASVVTPFLAYIPMVKLGGSGVIATAIVGFIIGNQYSIRFTPEFRLISRGIWPAFAYAIQGFLFLLLGLNIRTLLENISTIPFETIGLYALTVIAIVIIGRFIWEYIAVGYLPRLLFPSIRKNDPYPGWQTLFIISWAGMRGSISLAAALSVPFLPVMVNGVNPRDLVIFLVCSVIIATLILQGITLPWFIKALGIHKHGEKEKYNEHLAELTAKIKMSKKALHWLLNYKKEIADNPELLKEVKIFIQQYRMLIRQLKERLAKHNIETLQHNEEEETRNDLCLTTQVVNIERTELLKQWRLEKINLMTRNKLLGRLDHRLQHLAGS